MHLCLKDRESFSQWSRDLKSRPRYYGNTYIQRQTKQYLRQDGGLQLSYTVIIIKI